MDYNIDLNLLSVVFNDSDILSQNNISKLKSKKPSNFQEAVSMLREMIREQSGEQVCCSSMIDNSCNYRILSGIKSLDSIINGFLVGNVYEICGISSVGKSQLCMSISVNVIHQYQRIVHFISTIGNFSAKRVLQMLKSKSSVQEAKQLMEYLEVTYVTSIYELITLLHNICNCGVSDNCCLIVIDSITALYLPFIGSPVSNGRALLNYLSSAVKYISVKYNVVILMTTLRTENTFNCSKNEEPKSLLGRQWLHVPSTRFVMTRQGQNVLNFTVLHSNEYEMGTSCNLQITDGGIV